MKKHDYVADYTHCRNCGYSSPLDLGVDGMRVWCCDYIGHTGHRRGCKPGAKCKRFEARKEEE